MPKPFGDLCKVRLPRPDEYGFGGDQTSKDEANGILVELPEQLPYLGFYSFAFESSLYHFDENKELLENYYRPLVGKRVYWSAMKERGSVLKEGEDVCAYIKLTDIIAWDEPDSEAENIYGSQSEIKL